MSNVLIVDDSPIDRQLFEGILSKKMGISIFHAENGVEALQKISDWQIDLVVTDLQMPEMDGLELVKSMRESFPSVPSILVTGVGSEEIATEALVAGAAGYVPKDRAADLLLPTVQSVFEFLFVEHSFAKLLEKATETRFNFVIDNDERYFPAIIELSNRMLESLSPMDRIERLRCCVAIEHALGNALYRGNLEMSRSEEVEAKRTGKEEFDRLVERRRAAFQHRTLQVTIDIQTFGFTCRIHDQGPGFEPTQQVEINGKSGRGLTIMRMFMDNVEFSRQGNEVTLIRNWKSHESIKITEEEIDSLLATPASALNLGIFCGVQCGLKVELDHPTQLVGSEPTCHIVIDDELVSPHHCELKFREGVWSIQVLAGNEVELNGKAIELANINPADRLTIGSREYVIEYETGQS